MTTKPLLRFLCGFISVAGPVVFAAEPAVDPVDEASQPLQSSQEPVFYPGDEVLTNVVSFRNLANRSFSCSFKLEGTVLWASAEMGEIILQDSSGGIRIQSDLRSQPALRTGDRVRVSGRAIAGPRGLHQVLIENDGRHAPTELSESVYLPAGRHLIRLDYFNGLAGFDLNLEYEGPNVPRQKIPDSAFFKTPRSSPTPASRAENGLACSTYEGNWQMLPDFSQMTPVKTGTVSNLDLSIRTRDQYFAVQFGGYLEIPCAGVFTFWLRSDDGSRLYLGGSPLTIVNLGPGRLPTPQTFDAGTGLPREDDGCWAQTEGILLSLAPEPGGGMNAVVGSGTNRFRLDIADATAGAPPLFSTVRATGIWLGNDATGVAAGAGMLIPGFDRIEVLKHPVENPPLANAVTLAQLRTLVSAGQCAPGSVQVQGVVLTADAPAGTVTLADGSGAALLEMESPGWPVRPGQRIKVSGTCQVEGSRLRFRQSPLVDNNGIHNLVEKSAAIFLSAGRHPLQLCYFNRESPEALELYWEGPGRAREKIPEAALQHAEPGEGENEIQWAQGLDYRAYEGRWSQAPSPFGLWPLKQGISRDFDTSLATRATDTALEFTGWLEVRREGVYTFTAASDDGCLLFVDSAPTRLDVMGDGPVPAPEAIAARQILTERDQHRWAEVEGRVTFASERSGILALELNAGTGRMRVEVGDSTGTSPLLLLNSQIRVTGICQADYTPDGQLVAGSLLAPSVKQIEYLEMAPGRWSDYPMMPTARLHETTVRGDSETVVHVRGKIVAQAQDGSLVLEDDSGQVRLHTAQPPPESDLLEVEALGRLCRDGTNSYLCCAYYRDWAGGPDDSSTPAPVLTTIEQVKRLTRHEANRTLPVKVRGVVTSSLSAGCFVQDGAWAIYVRWPNTVKSEFPKVGEYWEIEGTTFTEFAPNIRARGATRLGTGVMPEPFRPSWDQLINGSLDIRYVEIQGVVTSVEPDGLGLLTRDGRITVQLELPSQTLKLYENALIRLRGCLVPAKDDRAHKVELGRISLSNCSVTVDEPAPADPFALPLKRLGELLLFDPRASSIQRVKLSGQILHERHGEYFLSESGAGLRFLLRGRNDIRHGDLVEVVGFPDLSGPSPVLREALARRIGRAALPEPLSLPATNLLGRRFDATLVRVDARLANLSFNRADEVLELQTGGRGFIARLDLRRGRLNDLAVGSQLELQGVYAGQGGDVTSGRDIDSFELLLNSPADVRVLQRPSWWTGRHALTVLGVMSMIILIALIWITQLRRQVEDRSQLLAAEVRRHEQTERQRALEQERARISRDLHDDLGASLTQIRLLSALESRDAQLPSSSRSRMNQVTEKSRQMVASLDEIVWAVNPANDSLPSLVTYLCQFAEEFLRPTAIRCRLDVPDSLPHLPLTSEVRHNLYLAVREALNNIAKHSEATEVWLRIQCQDHMLRIGLEDNGRGFSFPAEAFAGDGLGNMRSRLERIGGHFECHTQNGAGTVCRIWLALNAATNGSSTVHSV